jgi:hypothetical protein
MLFNFALCYAIRKAHDHQVRLKLNGIHPLLVYDDDVSLLQSNINTTKQNTEPVIDANKDVGLEANRERARYVLISRHLNIQETET